MLESAPPPPRMVSLPSIMSPPLSFFCPVPMQAGWMLAEMDKFVKCGLKMLMVTRTGNEMAD